MTSFELYTTLPCSALYSSSFFTALTFQDCSTVDLPLPLAEGSITCWVYSCNEPTDLAACQIGDEDIPAVLDLCPIMLGLKDAYEAENHSVCMTIVSANEDVFLVLIHFAKLHLFCAVNNNCEAFIFASQLANYIESSGIFPAEVVYHFQHSQISSAIHGFTLSDFPLWKLGTLLGKNYIDKNIINALTGLLCFHQAAQVPLADPAFLILPTLFIRNIAHCGSRVGGTSMNALCDHLNALPYTIEAVAFLACIDNHYTAYYYNWTCFKYRDTLSGKPLEASSYALATMQKLIEKINLPQVTHSVKGNIGLQGTGSGNCSIGALAWIEKQINPSIPVWTHDMSGAHCDHALLDLLLYNMISQGSLHAQDQWTLSCLSWPATALGDELLPFNAGFDIEYDDYNLLASTEHHPIFPFLEHLHKPNTAITSLAFHNPSLLPLKSDHPSPPAKPHEYPSLKSTDFFSLTLRPSYFSTQNEPCEDVKMELMDTVIDLTWSSSPSYAPEVISVLSSDEDEVADTMLAVSRVFPSWEAAKSALFMAEEKLGHIWKLDQSKKDELGSLKKIIFHCHHAWKHVPVHSKLVDPSDHHCGKSIKTSCSAHVNVNRIHTNLWHLTTVNWIHNHDREIPPGGKAPMYPYSSAKASQ
ncbi:hypothetical protein GYMLUDRAFT_63562 [Collybiopsis luxurians FD-317 M1]|uniref:Uncharacterized protein n=1 Tax=Collybiopsis luxurians FD-317 M1 TaxID=944289 RepID=A0A0D0CFQ0_9AGAR|nr:hypothetical protein GYMLUDRAFT_63562 [Collybiopsis luxurians FD-317 M1]